MVQKYEGYPSGSMVDFACDADGSPILAVSSLAVHTKVLLLILTIYQITHLCFAAFWCCSSNSLHTDNVWISILKTQEINRPDSAL